MSQLIRDSFFGRTLRYVSGARLNPFPEDVDPSLKHFFHSDEDASSQTSSQISDEEKRGANEGKNAYIVVGWYGPDDPEVSCHIARSILCLWLTVE